MKSKVYTRTGDTGTTSLIGGRRVEKDDLQLDTYGTVDELNSFLGLWGSTPQLDPAILALLPVIQSRLFDIGAVLASEPHVAAETVSIVPADIEQLEAAIDNLDTVLPALTSFVLPSGNEAACRAHVARTVCRRLERKLVAMSRRQHVDNAIIAYINRLSDYLFVAARYCNITAYVPEIAWQPRQ